MATRIEPILFGAAATVCFAAYLWMGVTTTTGMQDWSNGDLIIQQSKTVPVLPAFAEKDSAPVHMGIIRVTDTGPVVIEARETVIETPVTDFIARGRSREYAVYRVRDLTQIQANIMVSAASAQLGRPGDYFLDESPDNLYSSELVRIALREAGLELGRTERLRTLARTNPMVASKFMGRWAEHKACKRRYLDHEQCWSLIGSYEVISPLAIIGDARVAQVFASTDGAATQVASEGASAESQALVAAPAAPRLRP